MSNRAKFGIWMWALSCVLAFIGSLMPWATILGVFDVAGTEGDGVIVIIIAVISASLAARHWFSRSRITTWTGLLLGLAVTAIGVLDTVNVERVVDDPVGILSVGTGLYVVMVAGAAMTIATVVLIIDNWDSKSVDGEPVTEHDSSG